MLLLLVVAAALVTLRVVTELVAPGSQAALTVFGATEAAAAYFSGAYLSRLALDRTLEPWRRRTWALMGAAFFTWAVAQTIFACVDVLDLSHGVQTASDLLFGVFGVFMVAAGVVQLRGFTGRGSSLRTVLDGFLLGVSLLTVLWVVWFGGAVDQYAGSVSDLVLPFTYPVLDVVFLTIVLMTALRSGVTLSGGVFVVAAITMVVADGIYVFGLTTPAGFRTGGFADYLWILGFCLFAIAADQRRVHPLVVRPANPASWAVLAPYVALLPAAGFAVFRLWTNSDRPVLVALMVMTLLAMVRQFLVLSDHRKLLETTERQREQLSVMAHVDSLTGLVNRRRFTEVLEEAVRTAITSSSALVVAFVDLDRFKVVNDTFGHQAGDELLRAVADRLRSCVRPGDWAGRWGGDEFAVLVTDPFASAEDVVDRLRGAMAAPFLVAGQQMAASASVGAVRETPRARRADPGDDVTDLVDALLAAADAEMYLVKRAPGPQRAVR